MIDILHQKPLLGRQLNRAHPLSDGLAGCWLFNETGSVNFINNYGIWRHPTTVTGTPTFETCKKGSCVNFVSGSSESLAFPMPLDLVATPNTLICLFKTGGSGTIRPVNLGDVSESDYYFALDANIGNDFSYWFRAGGPGSIVYSAETPVADTIYMMAGVTAFTNDHRLYIDGIFKASSSSNTDPDNLDIIGIGALVRGSPIYSDCDVIAIWLYNRGLSVKEIAWHNREPYAMFQQNRVRWFSTAAPPVAANPWYQYAQEQ